jgi:hypothetical protein
MGIARGTNIVRDGLIYGYDSGYGLDNFKPTRFYKGKPAVNILTSGDNFSNWNKTKNSGSDPTVTSDVAPGPFENTLADRLFLPNDGSYPRLYQYFTPASTATHTFSVWLKAQSAGQGVFVGAFRNSPWALPSYTTFTITGEWVNYTLAINPLDTSSHQIYIGSHDSHKGKEFLIYGAQLETGSSRSTFVDGTRSATGSLIDLKRTTNIDASYISFSSTGQPDFDGTDDYIPLASNLQNADSAGSWEFVVNFDQCHNDDTSTYRQIYIQESSVWIAQYYDKIGIDIAKDNGSWFDSNGGVATGSQIGPVVKDTWYHGVFTFNQGVIKGYLNGVLGFTTTVSGMSSMRNGSNTRNIGRRSNNQHLDGELPVLKLYDKALSQAEVTQNYKAYKNRFNI